MLLLDYNVVETVENEEDVLGNVALETKNWLELEVKFGAFSNSTGDG